MQQVKVSIPPPTLVKQIRFTANDVQVPAKYTRAGNISFREVLAPVGEIQFKYGTAGFRTKDTHMPFIAYRTGVFGGYRARFVLNSVIPFIFCCLDHLEKLLEL
jgi:hypothetical protein